MKNSLAGTTRRHLDDRLADRTWRTNLQVPRDGWIRTIRGALGMRLIDVAKRVNMTEGAVRRSERAESEGAITLRQVQRLAEAMGCELVYAIVPKGSLERQFEHRVHQRALQDAQRTARTMSLERQDIGPRVVEQHRAQLFNEYHQKPPKDLWDE